MQVRNVAWRKAFSSQAGPLLARTATAAGELRIKWDISSRLLSLFAHFFTAAFKFFINWATLRAGCAGDAVDEGETAEVEGEGVIGVAAKLRVASAKGGARKGAGVEVELCEASARQGARNVHRGGTTRSEARMLTTTTRPEIVRLVARESTSP